MKTAKVDPAFLASIAVQIYPHVPGTYGNESKGVAATNEAWRIVHRIAELSNGIDLPETGYDPSEGEDGPFTIGPNPQRFSLQ